VNRFAAILLTVALPVYALKTDRDKELSVYSETNQASAVETKLSGNVVIQQGTLRIEAASADLRHADGEITYAILKGGPAMMQQEIEGQGLLKAYASNIEYFIEDEKVLLQGAVRIERPRSEITSERIIYNIATGLMDAGESGHRVQMTIKPRLKETKR
jgi:lipopolysaccharide export system protein LptA